MNEPIDSVELAWHIERMEALGLLEDAGTKRNGRTVWKMTALGQDVLDRFRSGKMSVEEARRWELLDAEEIKELSPAPTSLHEQAAHLWVELRVRPDVNDEVFRTAAGENWANFEPGDIWAVFRRLLPIVAELDDRYGPGWEDGDTFSGALRAEYRRVEGAFADTDLGYGPAREGKDPP
jgi:hypothetical protein